MLDPSARFSFSNLADLREQLRAGAFSPVEICARYVLLHLHARHPSQWLSSPRQSLPAGGGNLLPTLEQLEVSLSAKQRERLGKLEDVQSLFSSYYFREVVLDSHEGLVGWFEQRYPLHLRQDIPSPDEMLTAQCEGLRFVTLMLDEDIQFQRHGRHRDACAFLLHDFEHAHKFFGDEVSFRGQRSFFRKLRASLKAFARWNADPGFAKDLDYLKSDMNSHPVHLSKYLKAVVLSAEMRRTGDRHPPLDDFWRELFLEWEMTELVLESALRVNQPESEVPDDLVNIADFFMSPGKTACDALTMEAR